MNVKFHKYTYQQGRTHLIPAAASAAMEKMNTFRDLIVFFLQRALNEKAFFAKINAMPALMKTELER